MRGIARPARSLRRRAPTDLHASRKTRTRARPTPAVPAGPCAMLRSRCPPAPTRAAVRDAEVARRHADLPTHCRGSGLHRTHPTNAASPCRVEVLGREDTAPSALHGAAARSLDREPGTTRLDLFASHCADHGSKPCRRRTRLSSGSRQRATSCANAPNAAHAIAPGSRPVGDRGKPTKPDTRRFTGPNSVARGKINVTIYQFASAHAVLTSTLARSPSRRRLLRRRPRHRPRRRRRSRACA